MWGTSWVLNILLSAINNNNVSQLEKVQNRSAKAAWQGDGKLIIQKD